MGPEVIGIIVASVLGSTVLNTFVTRYFRKSNDTAEAGKTKADTAEIMAKAAETTLTIIQSTILSQDKRIQAQDERILRLEERVLQLHAELTTYRAVHGPLEEHHKAAYGATPDAFHTGEIPVTGQEIHITGDITGVIE